MKLFADQLMLEAWETFCDDLKSAGDKILSDSEISVLDRAEGLRHLTRLIKTLADWNVESNNSEQPIFFWPVSQTKKGTFDCPDILYRMAMIKGSNSYRISGRLGDGALQTFMSYEQAEGGAGTIASLVCTGLLETPNIKADADGRFEIIASVEKQGENWLPLSSTSCQIQFRDVVNDRTLQRPTVLSIRNMLKLPYEPLTARQLVYGLQGLTKDLGDWAAIGPRFTSTRRERSFNSFEAAPQNGNHGAYPRQVYVFGYWQLAPNEALEIELDVPETSFWNFHLCNHWAESLDYLHGPVNLNNDTATIGPDGKLRIVISRNEAIGENGLSTQGHDHGTMVFRFYDPAQTPAPVTRLIKLADLQPG
jgi:hypothetical protein